MSRRCEVAAVTTALDLSLDLAILEPKDARDGAAVGTAAATARCRHARGDDRPPRPVDARGEATGYQPWNVSRQDQNLDGDPLDGQRMGGT